MPTKNKLLPLAAATLLSCLMFASSRAFGQVVKSLGYPIIPYTQTAAPVFMPSPGTYSSPIIVTMSSSTQGAYIRYVVSTDQTTPPPTPTSGTIYSGPVVINMPGYNFYTMEVRAIAYTGYVNVYPSNVTVGYYKIDPLSGLRPHFP